MGSHLCRPGNIITSIHIGTRPCRGKGAVMVITPFANARLVRILCTALVAAAFTLVPPALGAEKEGSLTPCLAMDAAGGPIYPTNTFVPSGKELVAVFSLRSEERRVGKECRSARME